MSQEHRLLLVSEEKRFEEGGKLRLILLYLKFDIKKIDKKIIDAVLFETLNKIIFNIIVILVFYLVYILFR